MGLLQPMGTGQGFLKAGFLGFNKSGKTFSATLLACFVRQYFGFKGPIAFVDSETGSTYVADMVKQLTGTELIGARTRSFQDLMTVAHECEQEKVPILIVDSITHYWRELQVAYLKNLNAYRSSKGWSPKTRIEFQDQAIIQEKWEPWTDWYLNSKVHVLVLGRAGFEWDMQANESTGKKELVKTGIKMKVQNEFGFEPSLLMEMDRQQEDTEAGFRLWQRVMVLGDRFGVLTGKSASFCHLGKDGSPDPKKEMEAVGRFFLPHLKCLTVGAHAPVDVESRTGFDVANGDEEWASEKKQRTILCEEIQGQLLQLWPSQSAADKKAKVDCIEEFLHTRSWTKVEQTESGKLRRAKALIEEKLDRIRAEHARTHEPAEPVPPTSEEAAERAAIQNEPSL